ncbi:MAG: hypothetical protein WA659_01535 [Candidatus Aquirickettsiella sp.]
MQHKKTAVMASECNERGHPFLQHFWITARYALAMTINIFGARNDNYLQF